MILFFSLQIDVRAAQVFTDVSPKHSNYSDINFLLEQGVITASSKNYGVNDIVTREEVAVMVAKARKLNGTQRDTKFSDVPKSSPNSGYIQSAVEAGIINGYTDGTFQPNSKVTRGHMAAFIARAFDLPAGKAAFKDVKEGSTSYEAVSELVAAKITTGYTDGTFKPNNNLTRGHISAFLARSIKYQQTFDQSKHLVVHYIDVGQGDATLIQAPNGKTMLIDGSTKDYGDKIVKYIKSLNIAKLDYVVATHPDADHIGGLIDVVNQLNIGEFINSGKSHTTTTYEQLLTTIYKKNIPYSEPKAGQMISIDSSLKLQVLAVNAKADDNNDASIVLKLSFNDVSFLFMGDAGTSIESKIASEYNVETTILKAGHHGSSTSSSVSFLRKVKPKVVILSYGAGNEYGHPHKEVTVNISAVNAKVYATARKGTIVVKTDGLAFNVETETENLLTQNNTSSGNSNVTTGDVNSGTYVIPGAPTSFKNCDEMRVYYPKGVQSSHPAYALARDGDKDGWACEVTK